VLQANGRSFSAGFDLGHSPDRGKDSGAADPNTWDTMLHRSFDFGMAPWSTRKPVIASVQGHVLGGGCELTLMCDLTIAADDAKFGEPEVRFSHLGPLMVMPWFIGLKRARELLLFGDMIDAKTALEFGMVNRIVPAADLRVETMKYAKRLSLIAPEALRWGKRVINRGAEIAGFRAAVESGVDSFVSLYATQTEVGSEFGRRVQADGLKAALEWRRAQFQT
jgi:enoyl-CoA hydratase/carnithine racemase